MGRPWDLDHTRGGLRILHPYLGDSESGWYEGNADAIYRNREVIAAHDPDVLLVLSADHVYKLDYADVIADQRDSGAAVTMVTTNVEKEDASRYRVVRVDGGGSCVNSPTSRTTHRRPGHHGGLRLRRQGAAANPRRPGRGGRSAAFRFRSQAHSSAGGRGRGAGIPTRRLLARHWNDRRVLAGAHGTPRAGAALSARRSGVADPDRGPQRPPARVEVSATIDGSLVAAGAFVRGRWCGRSSVPESSSRNAPRFAIRSSSTTRTSEPVHR